MEKEDLINERDFLRQESRIAYQNNDKTTYNECRTRINEITKKLKRIRDKQYIYQRKHCRYCDFEVLKYDFETHLKTASHKEKEEIFKIKFI